MTKADGPKGAILQRDKKTYAIVPRIPAGVISREHLKALVGVVEKYDIPIVKITSGHRIALVGMPEEQILPIYEELGMNEGKAVELCLHYVQACPGTEVCKFGVQDSLGFGIRLEELFSSIEMPAKFKVGVSGCPFLCAESLVRDLGLIGKKSGWTLVFGGNSGRRVRQADVLAEDMDEKQTIALARKCIEYYVANAKPRERTGAFVDRIGIEDLKKGVLQTFAQPNYRMQPTLYARGRSKRQGWREFMRGVYWMKMPDYAQTNFLNAMCPLPNHHWTGETDMKCLREAIDATHRNAYPCMNEEGRHEQWNREDYSYGSRFTWLDRLCR